MLDEETQTPWLARQTTIVDGKIWINSAEETPRRALRREERQVRGLGPSVQPYRRPFVPTAIYTDSQNNVYLNDFPSSTSGASTPRPRDIKPQDSDRHVRVRAAGAWTVRTGCGSRNGGRQVGIFDTKAASSWNGSAGLYAAPYDSDSTKPAGCGPTT